MPRTALERARVRALAQAVACDIHPVNNLRILAYLRRVLNVSMEQHDAWYRHWIHEGLRGLEGLLKTTGTGRVCHGDAPTLADICIVPQVFNARRFDADLAPFERIRQIEAEAMKVEAFVAAEPGRQPDAE